jgi:hypothetical protein
MDAFVRSLGLKDAEGNPIETREEYEKYAAEKKSADLVAKLRRSGIDPETMKEFVSGLPEMQAARAVVAEAEREKAAAVEAKNKAAFDEEMRKIAELDPTVTSVEELRAKPYFADVYAKVQRGYTLYDAVRLATEESRIAQIAAGSAKSAAVKAASKAHLVPTAARGQGAVSVPAEVAEQYRVFFPGITDAEISKLYKKQTK